MRKIDSYGDQEGVSKVATFHFDDEDIFAAEAHDPSVPEQAYNKLSRFKGRDQATQWSGKPRSWGE